MKRFLSIFLAIVALTFAACTNSEEDGNNSQGGNTEPIRTELTVSSTSLLFDAKDDIQALDLYSTDTWTAEFVNDRASEWCSIAPQNGQAGDSSIIVSVTENNSGEERSASIIIKAKSLQKIVKVTQKQNDALTVTASKFEVEAEGGEVEIEVKANIDYDYTIDPKAEDWVKYKATRAMESTTLVFEVAKNEDMEKREAQIMIHSGDLKELVTIYQEGTEYAIILSKNEYTVSDKGETIAVEVKSNVDVAVEIPSDVDWVKENSTRAMSTNTYYFEVSPNEDYNSRSTTIKFTNKENNLAETVTITQVQKDAIVLAKSSYTVDNDGGAIDIEVGHNVDFDVEISHDWITKTSTQAFETETLTFTIAANNSDDSREGTIKFTSKDNAITQTVIVLQEGYDPTKPRNNEIWYTTTDGNIITPKRANVFGAKIVSNIFENGKGVITFDGSVTTIGNSAFYNCSSLTSITIPDSVTTIGENAFAYCSSLTTITIPDSVTTIGMGAFRSCSSLTNITIPNSVTSIGNSAFSRCSRLTTITIPDSVTEIGSMAFYQCGSLTSVTIPDSVTTIGDGAFSYCSSLEAFYGKFASEDHRCLVVDDVLNSYAQVGSRVYKIPDGIKEIGESAFHCCDLTKVKIPNTVTTIHKKAFYQCNGLTEINIPEGTTDIRDEAFRECRSLEKVILSSTITNMDDKVFMECEKLTSVHCKATTPPTIGTNVFSENAEGRKIYVPAESVLAYKSADGWKDYADAIMSDDNIDDYEEPEDSEFDQNMRRQKHINALRALYEATDGDNWRRNDNWLTDKPLYEWYGLNKIMWPEPTNKADEVVAIKLVGNNLRGTLPPELADLMDDATYIELNGNVLYGPIHEKIKNHPKWQQFGWDVLMQYAILEGGFDFSEGTGLILPDGEMTFFVDDTYENAYDVLKENELTLVINAGGVVSDFDDVMGIEDEWVNYFLGYQNKGLGMIVTVSGNWNDPYDGYKNYVLDIRAKGCPADIMWSKNPISYFVGRNTMGVGEMHLFDKDGNLLSCWNGALDLSATWYINKIDPIVRERLGEPEEHSEYVSELYTSTDYSRDGEVVTLQKATKGKGIDLVFMGDAYVDKHMDDGGKYEREMRESMEYFFETEPYKSLRDRFNVYAVMVVSPNYDESASNSQFRINYDDNICFEYASKINGIDLDKVTIVNVVNSHKDMLVSGYTNMYECGASVAHIQLGGPSSVIVHEAGGHGFAKLLDEYIYGGCENNIIPESEVENFNTFIKMNYHNRGWGVNVDTTNDPEKILWSHMLKDSRYSDEVGIYQGAWLYPYNLWRPSENSIMNDTFAGYFNAPSREAIYKAVMKLSEGDDWVYDYEEFVRFDKSVSTRSAQHTKTTDNRQIKRKEHKAPTIIKGSWRDAK